MGRRPLGAFCLCISLFILLIMESVGASKPEKLPDKATEAVITGIVYRREGRQQDGDISQVLYLKMTEGDRGICYLKPGQEEAKIGSMVRLRGKWSGFEEATNPGQFNSYSYYQTSKISFRLNQAELLARSTTYSIGRESLYQLRTLLAKQFTQALPAKEAGIMQTMLLGEKAMLDGDLKTLYQRNGIAHILAISGLHISLLGMGLYRLLRRIGVPMKVAAGTGALFLLLYGLMTGFSVSAVRAIIMFIFRMAAVILERTYDVLTALGIAGVLLLIRQPLYWYHSGFVFSFGCVLGITALLPVLTEAKDKTVMLRLSQSKAGWPKAVWSGFLSGCAVAVITFPIYLNFYYQFPIYSVLLNLLVLPLMSLLLAAGILLVLVRLCVPPLAFLPAMMIRMILQFYEWLCRLADGLPGGLFTPGMPGKWQKMAALAALLLILLFQKRLRLWMRWLAAGVALLILIWHPRDRLTITFLDVGQGDCIYIENEKGSSYLIDGGSSSVSEVGQYRIIPFLKYQGAGELEAVLVTHPDQDHCNGILELLKTAPQQGIRIRNLILPDISEEMRDRNYRELEKEALDAEIPISYISAGQGFRNGKMQVTCLHPVKGYLASDSNAGSVVLELTYGDFRALLTGDIEGEGEKRLITGMEACRVTVLKAAHHGSANSTSEELLALTTPVYAVISCGKNNRYGHPHEEMLERLEDAGSHIFRTDESGAITFYTDGKRMGVKEFLK